MSGSTRQVMGLFKYLNLNFRMLNFVQMRWQSLSCLGIQTGSSPVDNQQIRQVNQFSSYSVIYTLYSAIWYSFHDLTMGFSPLADVGLAIHAASLFLLGFVMLGNYFQYHRQAACLLLVTLNGTVFMLSSTYGYASGQPITYLNILLLSVGLFHADSKSLLGFAVLLPLCCLLGLEWTDYSLLHHQALSRTMSIPQAIPSVNLGLNLGFALLLIYYFLQSSVRQQKKLSEMHRQVRAALETDMKLTEDIMYAQVSKYSAIFEAVADGMLISNQQGLVTEVNSNACRLLGRHPGQLIGLSYQSLIRLIDQSILEAGLPHSGQPVQWESLLLHEDGSTIPVEITCTSFQYLGESFRAMLLKDVTENKKVQAIIQTNREIESSINYFATSLFGQNSEEEILWDVAHNCIAKLGFLDCIVYMTDDSGKNLVQKAAFGPKNPRGYEILDPLAIPVGAGIVGSVAESGIAEIIGNTERDPRYIVDDERRYSEITVPIIYQDRVIGVIDSEHPKKAFFQPKHLSILTTIASLCANKIMKARAEEEARKTQLKLAEYNQKIAEFKLMALRSQMNPHFIFNSLNSIQHLITMNERKAALEYLSTFSKLLRQILESSINSQVLLSDEIHILQNYLRMEALRFESRFDYRIEIEEGIDISDVEIPALLIQPYVENAIVHGLINKSSKGCLTVRFENCHDYINCVIEDNGIGREAAARIKRRKPIQYQSVGMTLSKERLELINGDADEKVLLQITDLGEPETPAGTRVEIRIPKGYP